MNGDPKNESPAKVLYVLGRGRSGSTIFANVIAEHDGFFAVGELRYLWDPVVKDDAECACGQRVSECPVWSQVLEQLGDVPVEDAGRWQREVVTERNLPRLLRYKRDGSWPALESFSDLMSRTYRAIRDVTGASVIVDSSKRPSYAAVVRQLSGCDLYCIHMVRDPRASAYSWASSRHRSVFEGTEVKQRNALDSTIRWDVLNLEAELLLRKLPKTAGLRLSYEDFVAEPREVAARVAGFMGEDVPSPFVDRDTLAMSPNHTIAGNPSRLSVGELQIRDRGDWRTQQKPLARTVATAVALPFLRRYGYPLRVSATDRAF